jgi:transcriptional regulator with XRE-family HTH domain
MTKSANTAEIEKFTKDLKLLRKTQSNVDLARKLGINPTRLSRYNSGRSNPGPEFIKKFYEVMKEDLEKLSNYSAFTNGDELRSEVNEARVAYLKENERAMIDELKITNEHLRSNFDKIVETNLTLAESNKNMSQSNLILAETNQKLLNKFEL